MKVLGIESSCDETSVALVEGGRRVVANAVASQIPIHARYGGVVPELASRNHVVDIIPTLEECLSSVEGGLGAVEGIAVTAGPGLVGSLLVGLEVAKALAWSLGVPLVGVNHIEAHLMSPLLDYEGAEGLSGTPSFPFVGLIVSGGHTHLYEVRGVGRYALIGGTRDDAAGEAFDKVAKMLGMPYPGGVYIDQMALRGRADAFVLPRPMLRKDNDEFSFSGIKTAVLTLLRGLEAPPALESEVLCDICASFQEAVVDVLVGKLFRAARARGIKDVVISGGVSANSRLRARALEVGISSGVAVHIPPLWLCTDNAAMIAGLGSHYLSGMAGRGFEAFGLNASSGFPMGVLGEFGEGGGAGA